MELQKMKSKENDVKELTEQKLSQIDVITGNIEDN